MGEPSSAEVVLIALGVLEPALRTPTKDVTLDVIRSGLESAGLSGPALERVLVCLVLEVTWALRGAKSQAQLLRWVERLRLEATWAAS